MTTKKKILEELPLTKPSFNFFDSNNKNRNLKRQAYTHDIRKYSRRGRLNSQFTKDSTSKKASNEWKNYFKMNEIFGLFPEQQIISEIKNQIITPDISDTEDNANKISSHRIVAKKYNHKKFPSINEKLYQCLPTKVALDHPKIFNSFVVKKCGYLDHAIQHSVHEKYNRPGLEIIRHFSDLSERMISVAHKQNPNKVKVKKSLRILLAL